MLWLPTPRPAVEHRAVREFPLPANATAEQPVIGVTPSLNATLPVGPLPLTVAVNVTLDPNAEGLIELANVVEVATGPELTTCDNVALVEATLPVSPA